MEENSTWEEFDEGQMQPRDRMGISLSRKGMLLLNKVALDTLGRPEAVTLYYDSTNERIGIKPSTRLTPNSITLLYRPNEPYSRIRALLFVRRYHIEVSATTRFIAPFMQNGMLILDLRTMRRSHRSAANPKATSAGIKMNAADHESRPESADAEPNAEKLRS